MNSRDYTGIEAQADVATGTDAQTLRCEGKNMEGRVTRNSLLLKFYHRYLKSGNTAQFIASVATHFTLGTLERLVQSGSLHLRRAAALAIGLLGDSTSLVALGPLLRNADRKLRLVVDDAIRAISMRGGTAVERQQLECIMRWNDCGNFEQAIELATDVIESSGGSAEVYHQRSLGYFQLDQVEAAVRDCRQTLSLNPHHYAAMVGLGHCYLELGDLIESLFWFRQALDTFPDIEPVRLQIKKLEKAIQDL